MLRKIMILALVGLILNLFLLDSTASASSGEGKLIARVKAGVNKLGTGKDARVAVKLLDGTKVKGYVSEIMPESFVVTNKETGMKTEIPYSQAKQVKGNNLSTGVKIAIGIGIVVILLIIIGVATGGNIDVI